MTLLWTLLVAAELLQGWREAESCIPPPGGFLLLVPGWSGARNWAKGKEASQSSTYPQWGTVYSTARSAVDGNRDGDWSHGSCSHTRMEMEPWWSVDLGARYAVSAVVVKNRQDCCSGRIMGARIHIGDSSASHGKCNPFCGTITNASAGSLSIFCCEGHKGRYVSVLIPHRAEYLTLCEIEVYGYPLQDWC